VFSSGYGGSVLSKKIAVESNDPSIPVITLTVSGKVEPFVSLIPTMVRLQGSLSNEVKQSVRIVPRRKYPFAVIESHPATGEFIRSELQKVAGPQGTEYLLTVRNIKPSPGQYYDSIIIITDSAIKPQITIGVLGTISE
jgi:hypothetical protein